MESALVRLVRFIARVKIWGAAPPRGRNIPEKIDLGGFDSPSRSPQLVDQVHRIFFAERERNRGRSSTWPILNIFIRSGDIRRRSLKPTEIGPNFACFCKATEDWRRCRFRLGLLVVAAE